MGYSCLILREEPLARPMRCRGGILTAFARHEGSETSPLVPFGRGFRFESGIEPTAGPQGHRWLSLARSYEFRTAIGFHCAVQKAQTA
jgi:hypothetical protein